MTLSSKIRVLIVDDSALVRRMLEDSLRRESDLEVIGTAPDPYVAREKILSLHPDVLTLDLEMPRMDGISFLKRLMRHHPLPVVVISSLGQAGSQSALEALRCGAVEVVPKPFGPSSLATLEGQLAEKIRSAARARVRAHTAGIAAGAVQAEFRPFVQQGNKRRLLVIGASTGGPPAVESVLRRFGADCPPMLVVQHIPAGFSRSWAARLDGLLPMEVREAEDGDAVRPGRVLIAPGNRHMVLEGPAEAWRVAIKDGPLVRYQRPSVDVLFQSAARLAGRDVVAALLTGMGNDGAAGMLKIREQGGWTIAQEESTCTVYGMPREAVELGAACESVPLEKIAQHLDAALKRSHREEAVL